MCPIGAATTAEEVGLADLQMLYVALEETMREAGTGRDAQ